MIDLGVLYGVLREVARGKGVVGHDDLSRLYHEATGDYHDPINAWPAPLAEVNGDPGGRPAAPFRRRDGPAPAGGELRAPGDRLLGVPGSPPKPRKAADQLLIWMGFVNLAHRAAWPETLVGLP